MLKKLLIAFMLVLGTLTLTACEPDGPAEEAGEKIDNAVEEAGEKLEEAGDKIKDSTN